VNSYKNLSIPNGALKFVFFKMFFCTPLKEGLVLTCLFFTVFFLTSGLQKATHSPPTSFVLIEEEKIGMEKFFKEVMLDQSAIFTLYGSKPMTKIDIHSHF
jgi:hypothetical protein